MVMFRDLWYRGRTRNFVPSINTLVVKMNICPDD